MIWLLWWSLLGLVALLLMPEISGDRKRTAYAIMCGPAVWLLIVIRAGILGLILAFLLPDTRMPWLLTVYTLVCGPVVWLWVVILTDRRKE